MKHLCLAIALVAAVLAVSVPMVRADVLIDDRFDDGVIATNTHGIGSGFFTTNIWNANAAELVDQQVLRLRATGDWGNGGATSNDIVDVWTPQGQLFSWTVGQAVYTRTDASTVGLELAVLHRNLTSTGHSIVHHNGTGGLHIHVRYNRDGTTSGSIQVVPNEASSGTQANKPVIATFQVAGDYNYTLDWLTATMHVNETGMTATIGYDVTWPTVAAYAGASGNALSMTWADFNSAWDNELTLGAAEFGTGVRVSALMNNSQARGDVMVDRITVVPEPATMGLLAIGALAALLRRRR